MAGVLKDLFILPRFDESGVAIAFTAPQGYSTAQWMIIDDNKPIVRGNVDTESTRKIGEPHIKECEMTQFWQLDNAPLESDQYWRDVEKYIEEK